MTQFKSTSTPTAGRQSHRSFVIDPPTDETTPITFSASSETPYLREFGWEVLSHDPKAVDLTRLNNKAAILEDHYSRQIGAVTKAWLEDSKLRVEAKFSRHGDGYVVEQDIRDGIRANVSIGYVVSEFTKGVTGEDGIPVYIASKWMPYEVSIVAIPADITVGVGRGAKMTQAQYDALKEVLDTAEVATPEETPSEDAPVEATEEKSAEEMTDITTSELVIAEEPALESSLEVPQSPDVDPPTETKAVEAATTREATHGPTIIVKEKSTMKDNLDTPIANGITLSAKEQKEYSIKRAIDALASGKRSGLEFEVSDDIQRLYGRDSTQGFYIPLSARSLSIGDSATGGAMTFAQGGDFIDYLRNTAAVGQLGADVMNLSKKVSFPRQTSDFPTSWIAEDGSGASIASASFDQVPVSPKKLIAPTAYSRELMAVGDYDVESLVTRQLFKALEVELDRVAIQGSGASSNQPTGLLSSSFLASSSFTSGSALSYSAFTGAWQTQANNNGTSVSPGWLVDPIVYGTAAATAMFTNGSYPIIGQDRQVLGYPVAYSKNVPSLLGRYIIFGDWSNCIVATFGGGIEVIVDPFTGKNAGRVEVTATLLADVAFKNIKSFAITKNINA